MANAPAVAVTAIAKKTVRVCVCSGIVGLAGCVERAFAASPLQKRYLLKLEPLSESAPEAEILLADPGKVLSLLDSVKGLKWMQSTWAGVDVMASNKRRDYTLTRLGGCMGPQMAEYTFGAVMNEDWRCLERDQIEGKWAPESYKKRRRLEKQTLGTLGIGDIAAVIAQRAKAFGMRTVGYASRVREVAEYDEISTDLSHVLHTADVIVSVLPSTPKTRGLLDAGALQACRSGKLLINVGRGDVVTEESLLEALDQGWIRRAVLDVFPDEPLSSTSKLWKHPSVNVTPHIAAVSYPDDAANLFVENLSFWLEGKELRFAVDMDKGY